jgi:hypothetical protein
MKANVKWREIEWKCFYETQAVSLEAKTLSGREAVRNVYPLALKRNPEIAEFNHRSSGICTIWEIDAADIATGCTGKCSVVKGRMAHQGKISKIFS